MGKTRCLLTIMVVPVLMAVTLGAAQAGEGLGPYLGADMVFNDLSGKRYSSGDGAGIRAGCGITGSLAIEASFQSTAHDTSDGRTINLRAALFSAKATLPLEKSHMRPFLMLGVGTYRLDESRGDGWHYGAGAEISLTPAFMLEIGLEKHAVDFGSSAGAPGDITSMTVGLSYRFR